LKAKNIYSSFSSFKWIDSKEECNIWGRSFLIAAVQLGQIGDFQLAIQYLWKQCPQGSFDILNLIIQIKTNVWIEHISTYFDSGQW
jgi:hypothetical protein